MSQLKLPYWLGFRAVGLFWQDREELYKTWPSSELSLTRAWGAMQVSWGLNPGLLQIERTHTISLALGLKIFSWVVTQPCSERPSAT